MGQKVKINIEGYNTTILSHSINRHATSSSGSKTPTFKTVSYDRTLRADFLYENGNVVTSLMHICTAEISI